MDEFDPIPSVSPVFKGLVVAVLIWLIVLATVGACFLAIKVLA